jgi:hypothetical protein
VVRGTDLTGFAKAVISWISLSVASLRPHKFTAGSERSPLQISWLRAFNLTPSQFLLRPYLSRVGTLSLPILAAHAATFAMMNGAADIKKAVTNQAKKVATTAALAANGNGQKKRRKGDNLKPIITTDNAGGSIHESPTQADPE